MNQRIETEYDPKTHQVQIKYGAQVQRLFQSTSEKISEVIDERTFAELCDKLGDDGPRELASGAILLSQLARSHFVIAHAAEWNRALTLVASAIVRLADTSGAMGDLPVVLVALACIAPVELPDIVLPAVSDLLRAYPLSHDVLAAYEEIRTVKNVQPGAVPTVASASRIWRELQHVPSSDLGLIELKMRLESSSLLYRAALGSLAKHNAAKGSNN